MIRKSNQRRKDSLGAVADALPRLQDSTELLDEAAAKVMGINPTDLRALKALATRGRMSASEMADVARITRGAMTAALDRIERAGFISRVTSKDDRRGLTIELTDDAREWNRRIWGPVSRDELKLWETFSTEELEVIHRFLDRSVALDDAHAAKVAKLLAPPKAPAKARKAKSVGRR